VKSRLILSDTVLRIDLPVSALADFSLRIVDMKV